MAFTTHCWKRRALSLLLLLACLWLPTLARAAEGIGVRQAQLLETEDGTALDAEFEMNLPGALVDVINRGVAVYFVLEVDVSRPRWYWLDERPVAFQRVYKLTYAPLTQQYRLQSGLYTQVFSRFEDARRALSRVRSLPVAERGALKRSESYAAFLRFRLDTSLLPKPLQLSAIGSRDWALSSDWQRLDLKR
jgi:hypothetical protein